MLHGAQQRVLYNLSQFVISGKFLTGSQSVQDYKFFITEISSGQVVNFEWSQRGQDYEFFVTKSSLSASLL